MALVVFLFFAIEVVFHEVLSLYFTVDFKLEYKGMTCRSPICVTLSSNIAIYGGDF